LKALHYSVDHLTIKNDLVFIYGWVFDEKLIIDSLFLVLKKEGALKKIPLQYGNFRRDVKQAFSRHGRSGCSGFIGLGSFHAEVSEQDNIFLEINYQNLTNKILLPIEFNNLRYQIMQSDRHKLLIGKFNYIYGYLKKNGFKIAIKKIYRKYSTKILSIQKKNVPKFCSENLVLIVDHSLGGGANKYREKLEEDIRIDNGIVVVLSFSVNDLAYILQFKSNSYENNIVIKDFQMVCKILRNYSFREVIYNNAVSIPRVNKLLKLLSELKTNGSKLTILIHDYYSICPSNFLLNNKGQYCGIPEVGHCNECLTINPNGFVTLGQDQEINKWRTSWGELLETANQVVCFSEDSKFKMLQVYPNIKHLLKVIPHRHVNFAVDNCTPSNTSSFCIGVIGDISYHKGAKLIENLAHEIANQDLKIKIKIIGRLYSDYPAEIIEEYGQYELKKLPLIIEKSGANIFLFPSICPETFSYTVQEIMSLDLPLACFDIGAPPERVKNYHKGLVMDSMDPGDVLKSLICFYEKIYNA